MGFQLRQSARCSTLLLPKLSTRLFRRIVTFKGMVVVQYDYTFHISVLRPVGHCRHGLRRRCCCVHAVDHLWGAVGRGCRRIVVLRSVGKKLRHGLRRLRICVRGRIRSVAIHRPLIKQQPIGVDGRKSSEYLLHDNSASRLDVNPSLRIKLSNFSRITDVFTNITTFSFVNK